MSDNEAPKQTLTGQPVAGRSWLLWAVRLAAIAGILVVAWACLTGWGAIVHGHLLYAGLLAATLLVCIVSAARTLRPRQHRAGWRRVGRVVAVVLSIGWIALMAWLRPFPALEPALAALASTDTVTVEESIGQIVLTPTDPASDTALFFQPGAKVDARAYAAILRPVAESGHTVVITKQPLGIAFLSITAFDAAKPSFPTVSRWVVGGHSLGGTVAAIEANAGVGAPDAPVVGLLLYASYPANDISTSLTAQVLSLSASNDKLATPNSIAASRQTLPSDTTFFVIDGAVHAYFGDYGPQPGDGTPTITQGEARGQISQQSVDFIDRLSTEQAAQ